MSDPLQAAEALAEMQRLEARLEAVEQERDALREACQYAVKGMDDYARVYAPRQAPTWLYDWRRKLKAAISRAAAQRSPEQRDALREALQEIIGLEDRSLGSTLANDMLRRAQAIAQAALADTGKDVTE
jgi:hypothetical protein